MRRRLDQAERELVETKEECIQMTDTNQALEREVGGQGWSAQIKFFVFNTYISSQISKQCNRLRLRL